MIKIIDTVIIARMKNKSKNQSKMANSEISKILEPASPISLRLGSKRVKIKIS